MYTVKYSMYTVKYSMYTVKYSAVGRSTVKGYCVAM
jgi:hypothetical protein